jgi:hypothetical protein
MPQAATAPDPRPEKSKLKTARGDELVVLLAGMDDREVYREGPEAIRAAARKVPYSRVSRRLRRYLARLERPGRRPGARPGGRFHPLIPDRYFEAGTPGSVEHHAGVFVPIPKLLFDVDLSAAEWRLYTALVFFADPYGSAQVGLTALAHASGARRQNVTRYLANLQTRGLIRIQHRGRDGVTPNSYLVLFPKDWPPELLKDIAERRERREAAMRKAEDQRAVATPERAPKDTHEAAGEPADETSEDIDF